MTTTFNGIEYTLEEESTQVVVTLLPREQHTAEMVVLAKQWCYYNLPVKEIKIERSHMRIVKP